MREGQPIHEAAGGDNCDGVIEFLAAGGNPNLRGVLDSTPLHFAAMFGAVNVLRVLIQRGAEIEAQNSRCRTPLHCAAANNQIVSIRLLLEHGADITARDDSGRTALMLAASAGHNAAVGELEYSYIQRCGFRATDADVQRGNCESPDRRQER